MGHTLRVFALLALSALVPACRSGESLPPAGATDSAELLAEARHRVDVARRELAAAESGSMALVIDPSGGALEVRLSGTTVMQFESAFPEPPEAEGCGTAELISRDPAAAGPEDRSGDFESHNGRVGVDDMPERYRFRFRCEDNGKEFDLSIGPPPALAHLRRVLERIGVRGWDQAEPTDTPIYPMELAASDAQRLYWSVDGPAVAIFR